VELAGRTDNNRVVNFVLDPHHHSRLIGNFVTVTVTAVMSHSLRGELALAD
jgi:tRNA-2-methylthio-N6-dimethylallyladenosine synthase